MLTFFVRSRSDSIHFILSHDSKRDRSFSRGIPGGLLPSSSTLPSSLWRRSMIGLMRSTLNVSTAGWSSETGSGSAGGSGLLTLVPCWSYAMWKKAKTLTIKASSNLKKRWNVPSSETSFGTTVPCLFLEGPIESKDMWIKNQWMNSKE